MRILVLLLFCIALGSASADEKELAGRKAKPEPRIPAHTPEWTNPNEGDPGMDSVADELQGIVVLCAKDPDSPEFKRAWVAYVKKHKLSGAQLKSTINRVATESFKYRQEFGQSKGERKNMIEWKRGAEKSMHDAAMPAVRNMK